MTASGVTGKHELGVVEFLGEVGKRGALVIVRGERERDVDRPASREIEAWKRQRGRALSVSTERDRLVQRRRTCAAGRPSGRPFGRDAALDWPDRPENMELRARPRVRGRGGSVRGPERQAEADQSEHACAAAVLARGHASPANARWRRAFWRPRASAWARRSAGSSGGLRRRHGEAATPKVFCVAHGPCCR